LTVKRNHKGELFIIFSVKQEIKPIVGFETGKMAGFDFGLGTFLVDSEGKTFNSPQYLRNSFLELQKRSRKLSRKKRGSKKRKQAKMQLISLHEKIVNQRNDWQWKMVLDIVRSYDTICLETLSFKSMQTNENKTAWENKARSRKTLDLSPYSFYEKLKYKAEEYGKQIVFIDKWFPSTKTCSKCGFINNELQEKDRSWVCPDCWETHDRDHNAAKNILREGTSSLSKATLPMKEEPVLMLESHDL